MSLDFGLSIERASRAVRDHEEAGISTNQLTRSGAAFVLLYVGYFLLLQSHALWQSPTLIPDRWRGLFQPIAGIFPTWWVRPSSSGDAGYVAALLYVLLLAALFALYIRTLRLYLSRRAEGAAELATPLRTIMLWTAIALVPLLIVPGALSSDLFSYVWYGRIFSVFGQSPFTHVPADFYWFDSGNWLQWVFWKETPSVYGPVWVWFAGVIATIAQALGGDIVFHLLGHKLLAAVAHLVNILLIWRVSGLAIARWWRAPTQQARTLAQVGATIAYAWNPLVMLEFGANAHNDVLMLTGVLVALWLHLSGRWRLAVAALAFAALVKAMVVVLLPGYLWLLFWEAAEGPLCQTFLRRATRVAQGTAIFVATAAVLYLPFWEGPTTLMPLVIGPPVDLFVNSLGFLMRFKLADGISNLALAVGLHPEAFWSAGAVGNRLEWPARYGPALIFATFAVLQTWRARTFPAMLGAWGWVLFAYLTVGAVWFWPWYVSWLVVVAALAGPGRLLNATIILSGCSMLLYATYWKSSSVIAEVETWRPVILVVPALVYAIRSWWQESRIRVAPLRDSTIPAAELPRHAAAMPVPLRVERAPAPLSEIASGWPAKTEPYPDQEGEWAELDSA